MKERLPTVVRKDDIAEVQFRDAHSGATVTLRDGSGHRVTLQFSRRHPRGVYRDASGRIFPIG